MQNSDKLTQLLYDPQYLGRIWTTRSLAEHFFGDDNSANLKAAERLVNTSALGFFALTADDLRDEHDRLAKQQVISQLVEKARKKRMLVLFAQFVIGDDKRVVLAVNDLRAGRRWLKLGEQGTDSVILEESLRRLLEYEKKDILVLPTGALVASCRDLCRTKKHFDVIATATGKVRCALEIYSHGHADIALTANSAYKHKLTHDTHLTHLDRLEAESIHIIREVMAEADNPVMLYSVGKDSSVMLHLARKAFYPTTPPFPLLHVDTRWKFQAMYDFRDYMARESGMDLLVHINPDGVAKNINPLDHGSALHTDIMKTQALKQALTHYRFDVAFGGARRDEEKSRAKERIFSFRSATHRWDPKSQRPELWNLYNGKKHLDESIRVFPISNWTELDIWQYIYREQIPIVPLYFAAERPVVERDGMLLMVDDDRLAIYPGEEMHIKNVRFRTLGCYPLTGAIESEATDLASIILELLSAKTSERQGRAIDADSSASMEKKKQEGYF